MCIPFPLKLESIRKENSRDEKGAYSLRPRFQLFLMGTSTVAFGMLVYFSEPGCSELKKWTLGLRRQFSDRLAGHKL